MFNIPNLTITQSETKGIYRVVPHEGYAMHNKIKDYEDDEGNLIRGYSTRGATVASTYDFTQTTTIDGYTAYGNRELFARPAEDVEGQIF